MTTSCRDADDLPRVSGAGEIFVDEWGRRYQLMHNGVRVQAGGYHGDWMAGIIRELRGVHEPQEERVFHEVVALVGPDAVMVEIGANWAYYSLWFLQGHPNRRAFLVEAVPEKLDVGRRNFELNGRVGDFTLGFIADPDRPNQPFIDWDGRVDTELAPVIFDRYAADHGIQHVDIMHADIQGAELDLLRGARSMLSEGRVDYLLLSTHGDKHQPCLDLLTNLGFVIVVEHTPRQSFSEDGLIVARSCAAQPVPEVAISSR